MKTRQPHRNKEYLIGFVEGLIQEYDLGLGPFLNNLYDYGIRVEQEKDEERYKINIDFSIETDNENITNFFYLQTDESTEVLRGKVQYITEEIIEHINSWKKQQ